LSAYGIIRNKISKAFTENDTAGELSFCCLTGEPQSAIEIFQASQTNRIYEKFSKIGCPGRIGLFIPHRVTIAQSA